MQPPRRIVTGHDPQGKSVFLEDGPPPQFNPTRSARATYYELWNTEGSPTPIRATEPREPNDRPLVLPPPPHGSIIRIVDLQPRNTDNPALDRGQRPGFMHRTSTIDYAVVLEGEIYAVLDDDERLMKQGDVLIQRGTDHAWQNRSDRLCRMLFVLIDATFTPELAQRLPNLSLDTAPPSLKG